jgi:hypothetical protein
MRFAIYVRQGEKTFDAVDAVPDQLRRRTPAVRGFDDKAMMTGWEVIEGIWLEEAIERQFADPHTQYLHIHFAAPFWKTRAKSVAEPNAPLSFWSTSK